MKPIRRQILMPEEYSFAAGDHQRKYFNVPWHLHEEYELIIVLNSTGLRYVGDSIEEFAPVDMVLVGANLPHCWLNEKLNACAGKDFQVKYLIIHFRHNFMGELFFERPEMKNISGLLEKSGKGIQFHGGITDEAIKFIRKMRNALPYERFMLFLGLLHDMANWKEIRLLSSAEFLGVELDPNDKMGLVHHYIMQHMKEKIKLESAADLVNMSVSGFCKYFKKQTKQSFISYVNELRLGYACKLLKDSDLNTTEIAFESGFDNYSNFFRQFKKLKGISPEEYKKLGCGIC